MSDFDDTPTEEGALNVALHQRAATAPFAREVVNIQGDENPGRAIGFDMSGKLTTLLVGSEDGSGVVELVDMAPLPRGTVIGRKSSGVGVPEAVTVAQMISLDVAGTKTALGKVTLVDMADLASGAIIGRTGLSAGVPEATTVAEMTALDPQSVRTALNVSEDPFMTVDNEVQFNTALAAGRSMVLRGDGVGGIIPLTTPKNITARFTTIKSDSGAVLRFTLAGANPRGITIHADDVTLQNFELTSTQALASNVCYGIAFSELTENHGHRLKLLGLKVYNWMRCVSKDGSLTTSAHDDCLIERCFFHTAKQYVVLLNFGLTRLRMRDCRLLGWLDGATHVTTDNAMYGGGNWRDCSFESCHFGNVGRMGFEATIPTYDYAHDRTRLNWCRSENCGSMGFSLGFVQSGIFSQCKANNVCQTGFEVGGRGPGSPLDAPGSPGRYAQAIIDSCEVDGLTHTGPAYGITLDGARDSMIRGATSVRNVTTTLGPVGGAVAIGFLGSERCSVKGVVCENTRSGIYVNKSHLPNTTGHHEISDNSFRNVASSDASHRAIYIDNQSASVCNNVSFQKPGPTFGYQAVTSVGAQVWCDGTAVAYGDQSFTGSNLIIPVP